MENSEAPQNLTATEKSRAAYARLHVTHPETPPAAFGLGLCDSERIMSPEQLQELHRDLAALAMARRLPIPHVVLD